jgi:hypothetical protein
MHENAFEMRAASSLWMMSSTGIVPRVVENAVGGMAPG